MGRPTEYNEGILTRCEEYLAVSKDEYGKLIEVKNTQGESREQFIPKLTVNLPSIAGLALFLGVSRTCLYEWKDKYPAFSYILGVVLLEQEKRLIENGLSGDYNSNIAKLALGKHGYSDKTELTGAEGKDLFNKDDQKEAAKAIKAITG